MVDVEGAAAREQPPEHDAKPGRLCLQPTGDRGFESPSLQRRVRCEPDFRGRIPSMIVGVPTSGASFLTGDRGFESTSLQQRVSLSAASAFEGREPRLSARVCAAGLATRSAETRRAFQFAPTCGNISVGPYSSTAVPLMWSARMRRRSQRSRAFRALMCGRSLNSDRAQAKPSTVR